MIEQECVDRSMNLGRAEEPMCCNAPMVHNSATGKYECADAYFGLLDDGVIADYGRGLRVPGWRLGKQQRRKYVHWLTSMVPDGW